MTWLDSVDMDLTQWVWKFEYNIVKCSEKHVKIVSRKSYINIEDKSKSL